VEETGNWSGWVGVGLEGIGGRALEFVDAARTLRPFESLSGGTVPVDAAGWPLQDARTVIFDHRPAYAWDPPEDDPDKFQIDLSGRYALSFKGRADVRTDYATITNLVYDPQSDTTTADLYFPPGRGLLILNFVNTQGGIRELRLIRPGYPRNTTQIFTDDFLAALMPFSVLRFMDFTHTNDSNPPHPARTEWSQRKLTTDATQLSFGAKLDGAAWEYVIGLGNASGKDIWINVPVSASDDYVLQLARLMKETLRPGIRIFIEYSNEVWNGLFRQQQWNAAQAFLERSTELRLPDEPLPTGRTVEARRVANRLVQIARIFESVYGSGSLNRDLFPVLSWWAIFPGEYRNMLQFLDRKYGPPSGYLYGIAMAPYFSSDGAGASATPEQILDRLQASTDGWRQPRQNFISLAAEFGLQALTYEGGPDSGANTTGPDPRTNVANRIRAHRHPRMRELLIRDMADNWFKLGGGLFMFFTLSSGYSRWGMWGLTEDIRRTDTPKFEAIHALTGSAGDGTGPQAVIFPHYAEGQGNRTRIVLRNNSPETDSGLIRFRDSEGAVQKEIPYQIPPWEVLDLQTAGTGDALTAGVVEILSDLGAASRIEGTEVFQVLGHYVSVPGSAVRRTHQLYVSVDSAENTGVAIFNPSAAREATLRLTLVHNGRVVAESWLTLPPGTKRVGFIDEEAFFAAYLGGLQKPFRGTLNVVSTTDQPVSLVGLLQKRASGALIAIAPGSAVVPD
jgi:hypothetical protein